MIVGRCTVHIGTVPGRHITTSRVGEGMGMNDRTRSLAGAVTEQIRTHGLGRILLSRRGWLRVRHAVNPPRHGALDRIASRRYGTYDDYVAQQRGKLDLCDLGDHDRQLRARLADRFRGSNLEGRSVLCLAARLGEEVRAFQDIGAFAVGVDLNPGERNPVVLPGDFHYLVFPDSCVDVIYTNSMDHSIDLCLLLREIERVLKPGGELLIDAREGADEVAFDDWDTSWRSIDDLVEAVADAGFIPRERAPISFPWRGEFLRFSN
jgi:SAM-dependent methyltransferase